MRTVETVGKTVEEAMQKALEELGVEESDTQVEIITEPSSGLFGLIGSKQARVKVTEIITPEKYLRVFLGGIMERMNVSGDIEIEQQSECLKVNVNGARMGMLIGKRGQTLNSLQYLLNVAYHKRFPQDGNRVILDVEDYRQKREETLRILAVSLAKKAIRYQREVVLEPMTPQERRIIHTALQDNPAVTTLSQGEEPYRKVVIAPK
jgi:spoIIIJ-associated protein